VVVFLALLAGALAIYVISRRAPVSSGNVNDSIAVTINPQVLRPGDRDPQFPDAKESSSA
jgi:hypothetical protein